MVKVILIKFKFLKVKQLSMKSNGFFGLILSQIARVVKDNFS